MGKILIGRKAICAHMGVCWKTVLKYMEEFGLPVLRGPGHHPMITSDEIDAWKIIRHKKTLQNGD